ncbi:hypothetical protein EN742_01610 [Mesorhizobium sp. M4A.F.Ca.ET.020.02.1.1]|uniref:hypothetical protein n=1 Tax=Mesorhizobium sp. M4A.F.Ca.ET.020.02.1.1 TaxID=2496652 RepID=UPI000FD53126|nr:hypothetical protein [Mesorhizobium sp. M4A.F.Ca.ET.020.02.1.1]RVD44640.1 hypothetical protein EN742_01610 [Mesorhizobium sp. M4A.F.Ca.ET.020.02.1.1]
MPEHLEFGANLTAGAHDAAIRATYLGQAHIAGTGPQGATCRECVFWHKWKAATGGGKLPSPPGYFSKRHKASPNALKKALCTRPILNKANRLIPHDASACRLFERADHPLPAVRPE